MSYVLHVWERPVPATLPEADRIQAQLSEEHGAQNPKFMALARELTQLYPCITTLPEESPDAVWSDGPLDGKTDRPLYAIGIRTERLPDALPAVLAAAAQLGLTVYDMQAGRSHLPDGKILGAQVPSGMSEDRAIPGELDSTTEVIQPAMRQLQPILEAEGFKRHNTDSAFVRPFPGFTQDISIHAESAYPNYRFKLFVTFFFKAGLDDLNAALGLSAPQYEVCSATEKFRSFIPADIAGYPEDGWFHVRTASELASALKVQARYLREVVLPYISGCDTVAGINKLLNRIPVADNPLYGNGGPAIHVLIAYLAGDPHRRQLEEHLLAEPCDYERPRLPKMISYLAAKSANGATGTIPGS